MADWPLRTLGAGARALDLAAILGPLLLALWLAWRARAPRDAAEFDGRAAQLSPWSCGLSLAASDLAFAAALIALPLAAASPGGGLVCLQGLAIGGLLGRWIVARWILPACFAARGRSALAALEERLGRGAGALVAALFAIGALLATAGRVFLFVFALHVALGANLPGGSALGGWMGFGLIALGVWALALLSYLVRGLRGSVAGDGLLFLVLLAAVAAGLVGLVAEMSGGWGLFFEVLRGSRKHVLLDFSASPGLEHTFWTAFFVSSLASAAHYGADPLQLTRLVATGSLARARKALWISLAGLLPALGLCLLGAGLLAWTERNALSEAAAPLVAAFGEARWPVIAIELLAPWARALVLAGCAVSAVVAAKSALAALLQLALARRRSRGAPDPGLGRVRLHALAWAAAALVVGLVLGPWIAGRPAVLEGLQACGQCALGLLAAASALMLLRRPPRAEGLAWAARSSSAGPTCWSGPAVASCPTGSATAGAPARWSSSPR
jgi:hypothetical protein